MTDADLSVLRENIVRCKEKLIDTGKLVGLYRQREAELAAKTAEVKTLQAENERLRTQLTVASSHSRTLQDRLSRADSIAHELLSLTAIPQTQTQSRPSPPPPPPSISSIPPPLSVSSTPPLPPPTIAPPVCVAGSTSGPNRSRKRKREEMEGGDGETTESLPKPIRRPPKRRRRAAMLTSAPIGSSSTIASQRVRADSDSSSPETPSPRRVRRDSLPAIDFTPQTNERPAPYVNRLILEFAKRYNNPSFTPSLLSSLLPSHIRSWLASRPSFTAPPESLSRGIFLSLSRAIADVSASSKSNSLSLELLVSVCVVVICVICESKAGWNILLNSIRMIREEWFSRSNASNGIRRRRERKRATFGLGGITLLLSLVAEVGIVEVRNENGNDDGVMMRSQDCLRPLVESLRILVADIVMASRPFEAEEEAESVFCVAVIAAADPSMIRSNDAFSMSLEFALGRLITFRKKSRPKSSESGTYVRDLEARMMSTLAVACGWGSRSPVSVALPSTLSSIERQLTETVRSILQALLSVPEFSSPQSLLPPSMYSIVNLFRLVTSAGARYSEMRIPFLQNTLINEILWPGILSSLRDCSPTLSALRCRSAFMMLGHVASLAAAEVRARGTGTVWVSEEDCDDTDTDTDGLQAKRMPLRIHPVSLLLNRLATVLDAEYAGVGYDSDSGSIECILSDFGVQICAADGIANAFERFGNSSISTIVNDGNSVGMICETLIRWFHRRIRSKREIEMLTPSLRRFHRASLSLLQSQLE